MIIAVFSMGQFISSKLDVLKSGFQDWLTSQKKEVTGETVWQWMAAHLAPLRVGEMTLAQFCEQFNKHFEVNMPFSEFSRVFTSMCVLDKASLERVSQFKAFLKDHEGVQFVLVSHTNYAHLHFILSQLKETLPEGESLVINDESEWLKSGQILFAPSMSSKCTEHPDTLKYAASKLELSSDDLVVSFLNTIKKFDHTQFSYVDPGKDLEKVKDTLESLVQAKISLSCS
jgi:hypothetical protein